MFKFDLGMVVQVALLVAGLLAIFMSHEGARKMVLAFKLGNVLHKEERHRPIAALFQVLSAICWGTAILLACALMVSLFYIVGAEPKELGLCILLGIICSAVTSITGALSGYHER